MPALLDLTFHIVRSHDTAELEVDPAPAPSLCLREQCGCGWAVCIGWLDGKERREHTKSILFMNDFDEPEISQTRPSRPGKILPQASPVAACLRPEHTMPGAKETNCFRFLPLKCLKL